MVVRGGSPFAASVWMGMIVSLMIARSLEYPKSELNCCTALYYLAVFLSWAVLKSSTVILYHSSLEIADNLSLFLTASTHVVRHIALFLSRDAASYSRRVSKLGIAISRMNAQPLDYHSRLIVDSVSTNCLRRVVQKNNNWHPFSRERVLL